MSDDARDARDAAFEQCKETISILHGTGRHDLEHFVMLTFIYTAVMLDEMSDAVNIEMMTKVDAAIDRLFPDQRTLH